MKVYSIVTALLVMVLYSCGNNTNHNRDNNEIESVPEISIPQGYTSSAIEEYVATTEEERCFMHDMKKMESARNAKDCELIVDLYYPDYFKLLHMQVPEKSEEEIKSLTRKYIEQNIDGLNAVFTNQWDKAVGAGVCITDIKNKFKENGGILYLYEYHTTLYSNTDTIYKKEAEYSVAASIDNGETWYQVAPSGGSWDDVFDILEIRFSHQAIDKVLSR